MKNKIEFGTWFGDRDIGEFVSSTILDCEKHKRYYIDRLKAIKETDDENRIRDAINESIDFPNERIPSMQIGDVVYEGALSSDDRSYTSIALSLLGYTNYEIVVFEREWCSWGLLVKIGLRYVQ